VVDTKELLVQYKNGTNIVSLYSDGTKLREGDARSVFPETIDLKLTDYCDMGCSFCHEQSTRQGTHCDTEWLLNTALKDIPTGVEIAIGGGNPLAHPDLEHILNELSSRGIICNLTVNLGHVRRYYPLLERLILNSSIKGLGVSYTHGNSPNYYDVFSLMELSPHIVWHVVMGVVPVSCIDALSKVGNYGEILILGYKRFGFGLQYAEDPKVDQCILDWQRHIYQYVGKYNLSFDNLAIEQLELQRFFFKDGWDKVYMGDDFQHSMYIDAVRQECAPTSRSPQSDRVSIEDMSPLDYFANFVPGETDGYPVQET
jgi:Radical SAM superfamily